jgi:hypothetical protein
MKSFLMGCGVALLLLIVIVVVGVLALRTSFKKMTTAMSAAESELQATNRDFPFTPPGDGKLTETQLTTWIKVREAIAAYDKEHFAKVQRGGFQAITAGFKVLPDTIREYARILRQEKMSAEEYGWITGQVMGALKSRAAGKDPKTAELARLAEEYENPVPGPRAPSIRGQRGRAPQFAPLAPEDAQPILELLKKHETAFRKVARRNISDGFLAEMMRNRRNRPGTTASEDQATSGSNSWQIHISAGNEATTH